MEFVDTLQIRTFLEEVGKRYPQAAQLILLGGSALCLLGSSRPTLDIDYYGPVYNCPEQTRSRL
jgi:hypothetical protein